MKYFQHNFLNDFNGRIYSWKMSPIIRYLDRNKINKVRKEINENANLVKSKFLNYYNNYDASVIRDLRYTNRGLS